MADINSPLGRRQLAMQGQGRRAVYTVPDATGMSAESTQFDDMDAPPGPSMVSEEEMVHLQRQRQQQMMQQNFPSGEVSRENLQKMRQESKQAKQELGGKARNRIELLLGLKRKTKEVEIEGVKFTLKTLKHSEYQEVFANLSKFGEANNFVISLEMQIQSLVRAVTHIDNVPIENVLNAESMDDLIAYFREFDNELIEQLYTEFKSIKEANEVKPEEEKEVNEDLKK